MTPDPQRDAPGAAGDAAIGAGLAAARDARPIGAAERIHVLGIAGAGASAAALLGRRAGGEVSGCDPGGPSQYTAAVEAAGIAIAWRHDAAHIRAASPPPARLAVTKALTAIDPDHPELVAAREAGIPVEPWQQVVADAASGRRLVAVAGTHGKSTTAGWLVHVLVSVGADPSAFVGALLPAALTGGPVATARWGGGEAFVVEADEYAGNFDAYRPDLAVLTSLEWDHPDVFADLDAVTQAFERWLVAARRARGETRLVANVGDPNVAQLCRRLAPDWPGELVATALAPDGHEPLVDHPALLAAQLGGPGERRALVGRVTRTDPTRTRLEVEGTGLATGSHTVELSVAGRHNASNALGVLAAALPWVPEDRHEAVLAALGSFRGVGRRLEHKGEAHGVVVYDDYAHHPTAIRVTIAALRQREPGRRLWAVYEPLTYHRTAAMLPEFADAMSAADAAVVAEIWPGRDRDTSVTSAAALAAEIGRRHPTLAATAPGTVEETAAWLASAVRPGDAVLVMGGGRSYRIGELLLETLRGA